MMSLIFRTVVALAVFEATVFLSDFAFFDDKLFGGGGGVVQEKDLHVHV